jgi:hypothetical protein
MRTCGNCGETGHNRRTCPVKTHSSSKKTISKPRLCGGCGQPGHNRRTCPVKDTPKVVVKKVIEEVVEEPKKKKPSVVCSLCGDEGHLAKTCFLKFDPNKKYGPDEMECGHFSWWLNKGICERCNIIEIILEKIDEGG